MIVYHPAFDVYHAIYRISHLLNKGDSSYNIEIDRLRIWDYYLIFPNKLSSMRLKHAETDIKNLIKRFVKKNDNPYLQVYNNRKLFEKIKPYQLSALRYLASTGIVKIDLDNLNGVEVVSIKELRAFTNNIPELGVKEENLRRLLVSHFSNLPMHGQDGLKSRSSLIESKYDA